VDPFVGIWFIYLCSIFISKFTANYTVVSTTISTTDLARRSYILQSDHPDNSSAGAEADLVVFTEHLELRLLTCKLWLVV
jgi:hypothetical protein